MPGCTQSNYAQSSDYDNIRFKRYDAAQGLPSAACDNIYRDSYGFLWISNYYGVSIFDGTHFFNLPLYSADSNFNLGQKPHYFLQADSISMLISTPNGFYRYHYLTHTVEREKKQSLPLSRQIIQLIGESAGQDELYAATDGAVYTLNKSLEVKAVMAFPGVNRNITVSVSGTGGEYFYVSSAGQLIRVLIARRQSDTLLSLPVQTKYVAVSAANRDEYLICADGVLMRLNGKKKRITASVHIPFSQSQAENGSIVCIARDMMGNFWLGGRNKLCVYFPASNFISDKTASLSTVSGKGNVNIVSISTHNNEVYLSTSMSGLLISDRSSLVENFSNFPDIGDAVTAVLLHNNQLLLGSFDGATAVTASDSSTHSVYSYPIKTMLSNPVVQFELLDSSHLWVIYWRQFKLAIIDSRTLKPERSVFPVDMIALQHQQSFNVLLPSRDAAPIIKKIHDGLYYYSVNNHLYKIEGSIRSGFRFSLVASIASPHYITCIEVWRNGQIVIGSSGLQVFFLTKGELNKVIDLANANIPVRYVLADSKQQIYLLTTNGVYVFNSSFVLSDHLVVEKKLLPGNIIYSGFIDKRDMLWAATNGGAIAFDCKKKSIFRLSSLNSVDNIEFNTKCLAVDDSERAFFGGSKGITAIHTNLFTTKKRNFSLFFFQIKNQDEVLHNSLLPGSIRGKDEFLYSANSFSFTVHAISDFQTELFEMRYKMEGLDSAWRIPGSPNLEFIDLQPGNYKLRVTGKYADSDEIQEIFYSFKINPPFWRQGWFVLLLFLSLLLFAFLLVNYWYRKKSEMQRIESSRISALRMERERISQELHDDLGSGLTSIRLLSKSVSARPDGPRAGVMLMHISKISEELIDQMSEIIWVLSHNNDTFNGLIAHLRIYMAGYLQRIDMPMRLDLRSMLDENMRIGNTQRRNILLVVKEAFHNAVKHANASVFSVECSMDSGQLLKIHISDNGVGLAADYVAGNGLDNIKKRIASLNGKVIFYNDPGAHIIITIDAHKA